MTNFVLDVEADGPSVSLHSMILFACIPFFESGVPSSEGFKGFCRPRSELWVPEALAVSGYTREETLGFTPPEVTIPVFLEWISEFPAPYVLWSDNNQFDGMWINDYCWVYGDGNPFGFSSRRIGDFYCGRKGAVNAGWKHLRDTPHTHDPLDDARGNAEAAWKILSSPDVRMKW